MSQKISKKFIIVLSVFVAVILLSSWLIVSGTAENIYFYFVVMNTHVEPEGGIHLLDDLKPGKYLLQRDWGLDESEYIEVFDDHTVQFFGDYQVDYDARLRMIYAEDSEDRHPPLFSERNPYKIAEIGQFVMIGDEEITSSGIATGFSYVDENTLEATRTRDEVNDVTDFNHEPNQPDVPRYRDGYVIAHYIYTEQ